MSQPKWKLVANLGDVNPLDHGGFFVFKDATHVYSPEAEVLLLDNENDEDENTTYTMYRFGLDKCTFENGVLSDNPFHPGHSAWFAAQEERKKTRPQDTTYLSNVCDCCDWELDDLRIALCSDNVFLRARAYQDLASYHGYDNFDSYPLRMSHEEATRRYSSPKYQEVS